MSRPDRAAMRFVRALLSHGGGSRDGQRFRVDAAAEITLLASTVGQLQSAGVLLGDRGVCSAGTEAETWLRRQLSDCDPQAAQHRIEHRMADGTVVNLAQSPLLRLGIAGAGEAAPYLAPHQLEAGARFHRLALRAQVQARVTVSYSLTHSARGSGAGADLSDMAADARRALTEIARALPAECFDVLFDVCGLDKGLQAVEAERQWPRRSAKLVLRIALDHLARHWGLDGSATGQASRHDRTWLGDGARPTEFG